MGFGRVEEGVAAGGSDSGETAFPRRLGRAVRKFRGNCQRRVL